MKNSFKILGSVLVVSAFGLAGGLPAAAAMPSASIQDAVTGSLAVTVRHTVTGDPLPGLPVLVRLDAKNASRPQVVLTGKDGVAHFVELAEGNYEAFVFSNNVYSEIVRFALKGGEGAVSITIFFNPDIDTGGR